MNYWLALEMTSLVNTGVPIEYEPLDEDMDLDCDIEEDDD